MRQIALDTETTGMDIHAGNRVIEIGCIEIYQRQPTGREFHVWLNPDRDSEPGALNVHGLTREFLSDKPRFAEVADRFLDFIDGAELLIHNAAFDLGFLDRELSLLGHPVRISARNPVLDTLKLARERHPGQRNSLDALCKRYQVDNSGRSYHGALLDARLLVEVYLAVTAGQGSLVLESAAPASMQSIVDAVVVRLPRRIATACEMALHEARVSKIESKSGKPSLWRQWASMPI